MLSFTFFFMVCPIQGVTEGGSKFSVLLFPQIVGRTPTIGSSTGKEKQGPQGSQVPAEPQVKPFWKWFKETQFCSYYLSK